MATQKCTSCGAPLPLKSADGILTCTHCDADNYSTQPQKNKPNTQILKELNQVINISGQQSKAVDRKIFVYGLIILFIVGATVIISLNSDIQKSTKTPLPITKIQIPKPGSKSTLLLMNDLRTIEKYKGYQKFDLQEIPQNLTDLKVLDFVYWAKEQALMWSPDAQVHHIQIDHYPSNGPYNLMKDDKTKISISLISPTKYDIAVQSKAVSDEKVPWMLRFYLEKENLRIGALAPLTSGYQFSENPFPSDLCSFETMLETLKANDLPMRPFYSFQIRNYKNTWNLNSSSTDFSFKRKPLGNLCH